MGKTKDAAQAIEDWIASNYFLGMKEKLNDEGFECDSKVDSPWYTSDAPRSKCMEVHNVVMPEVVKKLEADHSLPYIIKKVTIRMLKHRVFSDKEITDQKQVEANGINA